MPENTFKSPHRMPAGVPHEVDVHVGGKLRDARKTNGLSQTLLGDAVGLTFQQIQKYERGANRIGASRLFQFSEILKQPVSFFFDDLPGQSVLSQSDFDLGGLNFDADPRDDSRGIQSKETSELVQAYYKIGDLKKRKAIHDLIARLAKEYREH